MTASGIRASGLALAALLFASGPALAETKSFKADLKPVAGAGSKAEGTLTASYDTDTKKLTWQGTYRGISTYATSAGIRGPGPGKRERLVVRMRDFDSPFDGQAIVSDAQAADLSAGKWTVMIHTAAYPKGELEGVLQPQ